MDYGITIQGIKGLVHPKTKMMTSFSWLTLMTSQARKTSIHL